MEKAGGTGKKELRKKLGTLPNFNKFKGWEALIKRLLLMGKDILSVRRRFLFQLAFPLSKGFL
jgi:hypothetical protein